MDYLQTWTQQDLQDHTKLDLDSFIDDLALKIKFAKIATVCYQEKFTNEDLYQKQHWCHKGCTSHSN